VRRRLISVTSLDRCLSLFEANRDRTLAAKPDWHNADRYASSVKSNGTFATAAHVRGELQRISKRGNGGVYATDATAAQRDADTLEQMLGGHLADDDRLTATLVLAQLHEARHRHGDAGALERVIELLGPIEAIFKPSDAQGRICMNALAIALLRDSERTGSTTGINRAVRIMKRLTQGGKGNADEYSLLGFMLVHQYTLSGRFACVVDAVKVSDIAVRMPAADEDLLVLMRRASAYGLLAECTNTDESFEHALAAHQQTIDRVVDDDPTAAHLLSNYGSFLTQYCSRRPQRHLLDRAVDACAPGRSPLLRMLISISRDTE
jgi:hypothetical protein